MKNIKIFATFCISLLAVLSACTDDWKENALTAKFSFNKAVYYVGEEVSILNETVGGEGNYTFQWDLGDGTTSVEANPKIVYLENGAYTVTLYVKDAKGSYAMAHKLLTIDAEPLPEVGNVQLKWISAHTLGEIRSTAPAVSDDNCVYMTSNDHYLRKFSAATGKQIWEFDLWTGADGDSPSGNTHTTPSIDTDGTIYIGTGDTSGKVGRVYAVTPEGTKKWVVAGDAEKGFWNKGNASTPRINYLTCAIGEDHIYMGNGGSTGSVLAVDKITGNRVGYVANADNTGGPSGGVSAGVVLVNNTLVWAGGKNGLFGASASALNAGGNVMWAWQVYSTGNDKPSENMNGSLAVDASGTIYGIATFPGMGSCAFALGSDGMEKWRTSLGNVGTLDQSGVVIGLDGSIIVTVKRAPGEATGGVVSLSSTGVIQWHYGVPEDVSGCAAVDQAGNIHFGTQSGNYYIIKSEASDEQLILKKDLAALISESDYSMKENWEPGIGKIWSSPTIGPDGVIYIGVTNTINPMHSVLVALEDEGITGAAASDWPMKGKDRRHSSAQLGGSGENPGGEIGQLPITGALHTDLKSLFEDSSYKIWLCAHRANSQKGIAEGIPENSLTAIEYAINAGVEIIELDARPTSDGVLVLMHDATIDRTTNGTGAVSDFTYQQLQQYKLRNASGEVTEEKIPTLEEALLKGKNKVYFNLDVVNKNVAVPTLVALLKKHDMQNAALVYVSNNRNYASDMKAADSNLLLHPMAKQADDISFFTSYADNVQMMQLSTSDAVSGNMVDEIKAKGWLLFSNIVGSYDTNMLSENYSGLVGMINKRINVVQTDYPENAARYLKSKGYR